MRKETEDAFVKENQQVIRDYLMGKFKGFEVTDTPTPPLSHMFIVTRSSEERYSVKVTLTFPRFYRHLHKGENGEIGGDHASKSATAVYRGI